MNHSSSPHSSSSRLGERAPLPAHDELGWGTRLIEVVSIFAAVGLLVAHLARFFTVSAFAWWTCLFVPLGFVAADLASGIVHWTADTWGSESMPVIGRRFLRPFRVHHVNPDDFLRRNWIDTNGDVAMIVAGLLALAWLIPLDSPIGQLVAVLAVSFCAAGLPTNQVHQWAHRSRPPALVGWLQRRGMLLSYEQHARHHVSPYVTNYCISTGWCNRTLVAIDFFPRLERVISRVSGVQPRHDEHDFQGRLLSLERHP